MTKYPSTKKCRRPIHTAPELSDAIVRGRKLIACQWLDPPADFPVLFSCRLHGIEATGCVLRDGEVLITTNRRFACVYPAMFTNFRAVEESQWVSEIKWEWQVTRSVEDSGPHLVSLPDP